MEQHPTLWSISPYLHHAMQLRSVGRGGENTAALSVNHPGHVRRALGNCPGDPAARKAYEHAYDILIEALAHYRDVFVAEPRLLEGAIRGLPDSPINDDVSPSHLTATPKAILAIMDENVPLATARYGNRLASVWLQQGLPPAPAKQPVPFGYEFRPGMLKFIEGFSVSRGGGAVDISSESAYPGVRNARRKLRLEKRFGHGSAVLGTALDPANREPEDSDIPLVMVGLPSLAVRDTSGRLLPYFLITGLLYIMVAARRIAEATAATEPLPVVVNLSFGILAGAKDGTGRLERIFDALCNPALELEGLGPLHLVLPMGNARQWQCHAELAPGKGENLGFLLQPDDRTPTYVEIRSHGVADPWIQIARPGSYLENEDSWIDLPEHGQDVVKLEGSLRHGQVRGRDLGVTVYQDVETTTIGGCRRLRILAFSPTANPELGGQESPAGLWHIRLAPGSSTAAGGIVLDVQRDDSIRGLSSGGRQARFTHPDYPLHDDTGRLRLDDEGNGSPVKRSGTVNAYATAKHVWRVGGSYGRVAEADRRSRVVPYSGLAPGKDPDGDVLAPCEESRTRHGLPADSMQGGFKLRATGTSLSAPAVAACLVRVLAEGPPRTAAATASGRWDPEALKAEVKNRLARERPPPAKGARPY
ncbi:hypothetical protein [Mangrovicoccus sp. HB161399]|uniref:hypothetical protein n=1 Tax=Mangrovicoccus sp. HB161399 TaxID=2720392 RepID=UPI0015528B5B|nr:hypothetical protein [Mangrovicoccus sp. HB161399]